MKKISAILILVVISIFFSCSDDDETSQMPNPNQNGFTFNSEFFTTDELIVSGMLGIQFTIIDEASDLNLDTGEFEGDPGQAIVIFLFFDIDEDTRDFDETFTNVIQIQNDPEFEDIPNNSFGAALVRNIQRIEGLSANAESFFANTGEVRVSLDFEAEICLVLKYGYRLKIDLRC